VVGTAWAAGIGGLLVLVGLGLSTALAPSFVRYRLEDPEPVS